MIHRLLLIVSLIAVNKTVLGQNTLALDTAIHVTENGTLLKKAWTGGLDCPMYQEMDYNNDGINDLFIFEHKTNRVLTFVNDNLPGGGYHYAPQYEACFPKMHDWAKLYDYDCDGNKDIFTHGNGTIVCYRNNGTTPMSFTLITPQINSIYHFGTSTWYSTNIFVSPVNVPAFTDIDNDGDMDILSFPLGASYIEYHKNYSMDSTSLCGGFRFYNIRVCWGYFYLLSSSHKAELPPASAAGGICPLTYSATVPRSTLDTTRHSGNILEAIDMEGDGDKDLLVGDIVGKTLLYIQNGGTQDSAYAIGQDTLFPGYDLPVSMEMIAAPYIVDVNNDGRKDLLVSNFNSDVFQGAGEDYYNTLFYQNVSPTPGDHIFQYIKNDFFTEEMIDVGTGAHPAFLDVDADGLMDMLVGSDYFYYTGGIRKGQISYYRNTGTSTAPSFDLITKDFANLNAQNYLGIYPTFGDIDGDLDVDMILGNTDGTITLYKNTAGPGNPVNFIFDSINYQNISVGGAGMQSIPQLYDVNKDGKLDLVIGKRTGVLYYYQNTGSTTNPVFTLITNNFGGVDVHDPNNLLGYSAPLLYDVAGVTNMLVGSYSGYIYHYNNIDNNLGGNFTLVDSMYQKIFEPTIASPAMADLNADGLFDLAIGNLAGGLRYYTQQVISVSETIPDPLFSIYPNPASNLVTIEFGNSGMAGKRVTIYNVVGEVVYRETSRSVKQVIDVSVLPKGYYLVNVEDNGKSMSQKLVID